MSCPHCGAKNPARAQFCSHCGAGLERRQDAAELRSLLDKGDMGALTERASAWVRQQPGEALALRWLGHACFFSGRHEEALENYRAACRKDPSDFESTLQAGTLCLALGRPLEAEALLEKAVSLTPQPLASPLSGVYGQEAQAWIAAAWLNLGLARRESGDLEAAASCLEKAGQEDGKNVQAFSVLGELRLRQGDFAKAIAAYERALAIAGEGSNALALRNDLGVACFRSNQLEKALEHFKWVIQHDPHNANAIHNLGLLYLRQGDPASLAQDLQGMLKADDAAGVLVGLTRSLVDAARQEARSHDPAGLVGVSAPMRQVFDLIQRAAASTATVLVLGENGTGKEMVARAIHNASDRRGKPFIAVHCAALPESLLESELFGYEKGAFTGAWRPKPGRFELAEGGTLFLDEIGDLDPGLQVKLLRVIQERSYERLGGTKTYKADVRLIAATHDDLRRKVADGRFREDLFYRLYVIPVLLPPLRQRGEDIPELARFFLLRTSRRTGKSFARLHPDAVERLKAHPWPGNVRELENTIERAVALYDDTVLLPEYLGLEEPSPSTALRDAKNGRQDESEKEIILRALEQSKRHVSKAAQILGISRRTLYRKMGHFGIPGARKM